MTKNEYAILQEQTQENELELKKEILRLRIEVDHIKKKSGIDDAISEPSEFEFRFEESNLHDASTHAGGGVNETTVQSCLNLACQDQKLRTHSRRMHP
jgi:hypothetical protein